MDYQERRAEMLNMRQSEGKTLEEIGEHFGITRERVRQVIGNTGIHFRRKWTEAIDIDLSSMTREDIWNLPGNKHIWGKRLASVHHKNNGLGASAEDLATNILSEMGFTCKQMPLRHPFDILVGDKRVDVKHSNYDISTCQSQKYIGSVYPACHMKYGRDCDFFMVLVPDQEEPHGYAIFIIPAGEVDTERIRIPWPQMGRKPSKWHQFYNRFDLLRT